MIDFTEADVERVKHLLVEWFGHDEPTLDGDARDFLREIVPAMRERWRDELANEAEIGGLATSLEGRRMVARWLRSKRGGGDSDKSL